MEGKISRFKIKGSWEGDRNGNGTITSHDVQIPISAPAQLDGPGIGSNPEDLLVASLTSCYFITLAFFLSRREINYSHIEIESEGIVEEDKKGLTFKEVIHRPTIVMSVGDEDKREDVERLAHRAEKACFITQTLKSDLVVSVEPIVQFV